MTKRRKGPHEALDALAFNDETVFAFEAKWSRTSRDMDEYAKFMVKNAQNAGHIVPHDLLSYSNCSRHVIVASGILSSGVVIPGDPAQPAPVVAAAKRQDSWYAGVPFLLPKHLRAT